MAIVMGRWCSTPVAMSVQGCTDTSLTCFLVCASILYRHIDKGMYQTRRNNLGHVIQDDKARLYPPSMSVLSRVHTPDLSLVISPL